MSRFHQRLRKRMDNPEFAAGYREMSAELALLRSLMRLANTRIKSNKRGENSA